MKQLINFSGISFEVGQSKTGLATSTEHARNYFHYLSDLGIELIDHGDTVAPNLNERVRVFSAADLNNIEMNRYEEAFHKTKGLLKNGLPLLNWGGDHSIALSTVSAFLSEYPEGYILWIDAHADLNLPEHSESGNLHGMPLSILMNLNNIASDYLKWTGKPLAPEKLIYLGLRDIDPFEMETIQSLGIKHYAYSDITTKGMSVIASEIRRVVGEHALHISFDIDSVDPRYAPSTGVPVKAGLQPDDLEILGLNLFQHARIRSVDIVEVNPELGSALQVDRTYTVAFNFLGTVFNNHYQGDHYDGISSGNLRERFTQI